MSNIMRHAQLIKNNISAGGKPDYKLSDVLLGQCIYLNWTETVVTSLSKLSIHIRLKARSDICVYEE